MEESVFAISDQKCIELGDSRINCVLCRSRKALPLHRLRKDLEPGHRTWQGSHPFELDPNGPVFARQRWPGVSLIRQRQNLVTIEPRLDHCGAGKCCPERGDDSAGRQSGNHLALSGQWPDLEPHPAVLPRCSFDLAQQYPPDHRCGLTWDHDKPVEMTLFFIPIAIFAFFSYPSPHFILVSFFMWRNRVSWETNVQRPIHYQSQAVSLW